MHLLPSGQSAWHHIPEYTNLYVIPAAFHSPAPKRRIGTKLTKRQLHRGWCGAQQCMRGSGLKTGVHFRGLPPHHTPQRMAPSWEVQLEHQQQLAVVEEAHQTTQVAVLVVAGMCQKQATPHLLSNNNHLADTDVWESPHAGKLLQGVDVAPLLPNRGE